VTAAIAAGKMDVGRFKCPGFVLLCPFGEMEIG
jgi:hypothetical protein